jgi:hypothetical protein
MNERSAAGGTGQLIARLEKDEIDVAMCVPQTTGCVSRL